MVPGGHQTNWGDHPQFTLMSNQHAVYLKPTEYCMSNVIEKSSKKVTNFYFI